MSDDILIFNPEGVSIGDYRNKYPELKIIKEFQNLSDFELVFIWYYSNPTSYYVYQFPKKVERVAEICKKMYSEEEASESFKEKFLGRTLQNQEEWDLAIDRMARISPDARRDAKSMVDKIFSDYRFLLERPLEDFANRNGDIAYNDYLAIRKTITKDLEEIIQKVENGFGINRIGEVSADGQELIEDYHKNRIHT